MTVDEDHSERYVRELDVEKRLHHVVVPQDSFHVVEALQRRYGDGTVGALTVVDKHDGRELVHSFRRDAKNENGTAGVSYAISYGLRQRQDDHVRNGRAGDLIGWFRIRPYCEGQVRSHHRFEAREPTLAGVDLEPRLASALEDRGIGRLCRRQTEAVEVVRNEDNVVSATRTANGKGLAYVMPALERTMNHGGRALHLGPQNVLVADQLDTLSGLARGLGLGSRVSVGQCTGRLSKPEKREVGKWMPTVPLSNPDMVHYALLPHAYRLWERFFSSLETVVIDEVHDYRGVFGSHVALLIRRLRHVYKRFGADPQFVCCPAAIGNPVEHVVYITGGREDSFTLVDEDTSETGETNWPLWNPPEYENPDAGRSDRRRSDHVETKNLFVDLVARGHQALVFTRA